MMVLRLYCVVTTLEIVVTSLLRQMAQSEQQALIDSVEGALDEVRPDKQVSVEDSEMLQQYVKKLLRHPRS